MKALVTGAGGFVGANLVRYLLAGGHEPVAVIRPGGDPWRLAGVADACERRAVDLGDPEAVERIVLETRPDTILHLAAHGAYSWQRDLDTMLAVNVRATEALLQGARKVGASLVHAGSSSEYGYKDHAPTEAEPVAPNSHYSVTKVAATHLCGLAGASGVRAVTLRLYSIYGPWEDPGRLIPTLVRRAMNGEWPPLVGPQTARDFVWIDDTCEAFVRAATAELEPGSILNIASGRQITLAELVAIATNAFGVTAEPEWGSMTQRDWDTTVWVGEPRRAAEMLGWAATTSLDHGLRALAEWFARHPELGTRYSSGGTAG